MVRKDGNLVPVDWLEAFTYISKKQKTVDSQSMSGV
jgi:predicted molibdopterin-dependent oxidoreductase YjgC